MTAHLLVEQLRLASFWIDALHVAELIIRVWPEAHGMALDIATAPIVAEIEVAIGPDRQPVGPTSAIGEQTNLAVGCHARASLIADFRQHDGAIGTHHRAFRK